MKKIYFILLNIGFVLSVNAQLLPFNDHYIDNASIFNPASFDLSSLEYPLVISTTYRQQWTEIIDGPKSFFAKAEYTRLSSYENNLSGSFYIINDKIGKIGLTSVYMRGSYIFDLSPSYNQYRYLSIGLAFGGFQYRVNTSAFLQDPLIDPSDLPNLTSWHGDAGLGVYYYSNRFHVGLASPQISVIDTDTKFLYTVDNEEYYTKRLRHYYMNIGFDFPYGVDNQSISPELWIRYAMEQRPVFIPSVLIKLHEKFHIGGGVSIMKNPNIPITFSPNIAISGVVESNNENLFKIGFSYGWTNAMYNESFGSVLEVNLVYYR